MSKIQEIADYRAHPALNYSLLKKVLANDTKEFKGSLAALLGNVLDCLVTMGECFEELYHVEDFERVQNLLTESIDYVYEQKKEWDLDYIYNVAKKKGYGGKTYTEERIREKIEELKWYYELQVKREIKEIISIAEYNQACYELKLLEEEPFARILKNAQFQLPLYGTLNVDGEEVPVKSLPDILNFEDYGTHKKIKYYDLKRSDYGVKGWSRAVKEKGYPLQMALTHHLLCQIYNLPPESVECYWMVVSHSKAFIVPVHEIDLDIGLNGCEVVSNYTFTEKHELADEKCVLGIKDSIRIFFQAVQLGLEDWDVSSFAYQKVYPKKSVYS